MPDDLNTVPAEFWSLGGRQAVFALREDCMNGGTASRLAIGQEKNTAAVDGAIPEGDVTLNAGAFAIAAEKQTASYQSQPEQVLSSPEGPVEHARLLEGQRPVIGRFP
jgi:hypothetical protein